MERLLWYDVCAVVQSILWIFVVLFFYRSGGIVDSVIGCCVPSLLSNGGA